MAREINPQETLDKIEMHLKLATAAIAQRDAAVAAERAKTEIEIRDHAIAAIGEELSRALLQVPRLREEIVLLKQTLEDRKLIEQAKGILMRRSGLNEKDAHTRLQKHSVGSGTKIVENAKLLIAAEVIMETFIEPSNNSRSHPHEDAADKRLDIFPASQ